ncbi:hypothetical protein B0T18DRAFT_400582 [Schizothecium vesticola]|uniref:Uncharacterized protein n=1 Tax=Schizothecium vesticola TaxID=314040 RepID=A0AA40KDM1_9PEZI|nr:hypothetical protein B0T18DRAFT_400582 [Schizothecium vesticola]
MTNDRLVPLFLSTTAVRILRNTPETASHWVNESPDRTMRSPPRHKVRSRQATGSRLPGPGELDPHRLKMRCRKAFRKATSVSSQEKSHPARGKGQPEKGPLRWQIHVVKGATQSRRK